MTRPIPGVWLPLLSLSLSGVSFISFCVFKGLYARFVQGQVKPELSMGLELTLRLSATHLLMGIVAALLGGWAFFHRRGALELLALALGVGVCGVPFLWL